MQIRFSRIFSFLTLIATATPALSAGVDAILIIPLYAILFALSVIAFFLLRKSNTQKATAAITGCVILLLLNLVFSPDIYIKWLANLIDHEQLSLLLAGLAAVLSPFVIVKFANVVICRLNRE